VAVYEKPELIEEALKMLGLRPQTGTGLTLTGGDRAVQNASIKVDKSQYGGTADLGFVKKNAEYEMFMYNGDSGKIAAKSSSIKRGTAFNTAFRQAYTMTQLTANARLKGIRIQKQANQVFGQPVKMTAFA